MKIESFYGEIAHELYEIINGDLDIAWIYVEMSKDTSSVCVYFKTVNGQHFSSEPTSTIFKLFNTLWSEFKTIGQPPWATATFIIQDNGTFNIDFGYDNIFDGCSTSLERLQSWIRKYLGNVPIKDLE
jgi:hypothetical protein